MQDFCFKTTDQGTLTAALEALGLVADGQIIGDWIWVGQVVKTPGVYDADTGTEITAPTYYDGEYAVYRATDDQAAVIEDAIWPEGVSLVDPPAGIPLFGGEWLQPDLTSIKESAILQVRDACQTALAALASRFSDLERQTWAAQLAEAKLILSDPTISAASYPTIAGIIAVTNEDAGVFAAAVLKNNEDWTATSANIIGQRQALVAQVKACTKASEVRAIDITITIPAS